MQPGICTISTSSYNKVQSKILGMNLSECCPVPIPTRPIQLGPRAASLWPRIDVPIYISWRFVAMPRLYRVSNIGIDICMHAHQSWVRSPVKPPVVSIASITGTSSISGVGDPGAERQGPAAAPRAAVGLENRLTSLVTSACPSPPTPPHPPTDPPSPQPSQHTPTRQRTLRHGHGRARDAKSKTTAVSTWPRSRVWKLSVGTESPTRTDFEFPTHRTALIGA